MPVLQRCQAEECRRYFPTNEARCPGCGWPVPRGPKNLYFKKKVAGKLHFKAFGKKTLAEAEISYGKWLEEIATPVVPTGRNMTFWEMSEAYVGKLRAEGKKYASTAAMFLTRMLDFWGNIPALDLTPDMIRRFQTVVRERGYTPAYADRHLEIGKAAWNYSMDAPNPFKRVRLYKPDNTLIRMLTPDEEERLLQAAKQVRHHASPPHLYEIIVVLIYTGLREANVLNLHIDEVDFETSMIRVRQKGNLRMEIWMNSAVREALHRIHPSEPGYFFPNPDTGRPYQQIAKSWKSLKTLAGITRPFRIHDLRHSFASRILQTTGNVVTVQKALGHKNIATSMKYAHMAPEAVRDAVERIGQPKKG